ALLSYYSAASRLQLAEVTTLYYAAPVVVTLLAWVILKEKVTPARCLAVGVGFVGVLIACNPIGLTISWPVMARKKTLETVSWIMVFSCSE
ncbi:EamA family transporter, partial [Rhizobium ruizarguesonis]